MDRRKALKRTGLFAGTTMSLSAMVSLLQSCQSEPAIGWEPTLFTQQEAGFISRLVDVILPKTETAGALDVKVDVFIDKFFALALDQSGQQEMRAAIKQFNEDCSAQYGKPFVQMSIEDQQAALTTAEATSGKFNPGVWGTAVGDQQPIGFYRSIKSLAVWAYMSSEEIGKNVLSYDPIPQEYRGCVPLDEIGRRWSL